MFMHTNMCLSVHMYTQAHVLVYAYMYMHTHTNLFMEGTMFNNKRKEKIQFYNIFFYINKYIHFTFNTINTIKHVEASGKDELRSKK